MSKGNDPSMQSVTFRMQMVKNEIKDLMFAAGLENFRQKCTISFKTGGLKKLFIEQAFP